jgi:hypothetical protein
MNRPEKTPLREAIRERFEAETLAPDQLAALRQRLAAGSGAAGAVPPAPARRRFLALAASLTATATATLGWWAASGVRDLRDAGNLEALADEIAYNHLKHSTLDVEADSLEALSAAFAGVGIALQPPPLEVPAGAELLGGRHCTIAGVPAVMLRYRLDERIIGYCQARFDPRRHRGVPDMQVSGVPVQLAARGMQVSLCHDRGVLMAVATV